MVDGQAKAFKKEIKIMPLNAEKNEINRLLQAEDQILRIEETTVVKTFTFKKQRKIKRAKSSGII